MKRNPFARPGKSGPRPRQSATLRMVAREAGVSASTVSRIINGTVNVSDGLKHAVEAAIAKFDFRPNAAARGLALGKTLTIGVVAQAIDSPFYGEGLRGIEACLRQRGYAPLFMSGNWHDEDEDRCMREFIARGVDGIIVFAGRLSDAKLKSYAKEVSIVVTGRRCVRRDCSACRLTTNTVRCWPYATWSSLGHRRIAFITGSENHPDAIERLGGYQKALEDAGIGFDPRLVAVGDWHEEGGLRATLELLESKAQFTALFCVNDQTAYGACLGPLPQRTVGSGRCLGGRLRRPALFRLPAAAADQRAAIDRRARRAIRAGHPAAHRRPPAAHITAPRGARGARVHAHRPAPRAPPAS